MAGRDEKASATGLCADAHGFSLHAAVRTGANQRIELERLCRYKPLTLASDQRDMRLAGVGRLFAFATGSYTAV